MTRKRYGGGEGMERLALADNKMYCKALALKALWYWYMNRFNRIESSEKGLTRMII